jgi:hypothetical protein
MAFYLQESFNLHLVGSKDMIEVFFRTITKKLEDNKYASRFPYILKNLYKDKKLPTVDYTKETKDNLLQNKYMEYAIGEISVIKEEFQKLKVSDIVHDSEVTREELEKSCIDTKADNLYLAFKTISGKNLIDLFQNTLEEAKKYNSDIEIVLREERAPHRNFRVGIEDYDIGNEIFLKSFFSTIAYRSEDKKWGSKYPVIMKELWEKRKITGKNIRIAIDEINSIKNDLQKIDHTKVIWDFDDISKRPPWGDNISKDIKNLYDYFVTSNGKNLIEVFIIALETAKKNKKVFKIE